MKTKSSGVLAPIAITVGFQGNLEFMLTSTELKPASKMKAISAEACHIEYLLPVIIAPP